MTTPTPWSLVERGEDSQGRPLYDIVSESADLIVARDLWLEDGEAILEAMKDIDQEALKRGDQT